MKKLIPILLALALAITSIIAFGTMFTGAEDPVTTMTFVPENLGTSVDNGAFKLGWFNSSQENSMAKINYWGKHYYDTVTDKVYSDSTDTSEVEITADSATQVTLKANAVTATSFIEFTAPVSDTYTFNAKIRNNWGSGNNNVQLALCSVDTSIGTRTDTYATATVGEYNQWSTLSATVKLEKDESVIMLLDPNTSTSVQNWPFDVADISATLDLSTADVATITADEAVERNENVTRNITRYTEDEAVFDDFRIQLGNAVEAALKNK